MRDVFDYFDGAEEGKTLIVGSRLYEGRQDRRAFYRDCIGVDMQEGEGVDIVRDLSRYTFGPCFSHVECTSVLEHCPEPWLVADNIQKSMRRGGTIYVSVPFVWAYHGYPDDYFRFTVEGVKSLFANIEWRKINYWCYGRAVLKPYRIKENGMGYTARCEVVGVGVKI
jgi:hypothetical protein